MMQAALQVAALDRRVEEERRRDGVGPLLQPWIEAAAALRKALAAARADLRVVIPDGEMLDAAVVPESDRMRLPAEADLKFLARGVLA